MGFPQYTDEYGNAWNLVDWNCNTTGPAQMAMSSPWANPCPQMGCSNCNALVTSGATGLIRCGGFWKSFSLPKVTCINPQGKKCVEVDIGGPTPPGL